MLISLLAAGTALAVVPEKSVDYDGGLLGMVTFSGRTHSDAGLRCDDCHTRIFQRLNGAGHMTSRDHIKGLLCGVCHNGKRAFSTSEEGACDKCHQRNPGP